MGKYLLWWCVSKIKSFKSLTIDIKEDPQGNVWFATQGGGLWRLDKNNAWKQYKHEENDSTSLVSEQVNCLVPCRKDGHKPLFAL